MKAILLSLLCTLLVACSSGPDGPAIEQSNTYPYSRLIAEQLMRSARDVSYGQRVAVTSPVWLDGSFQASPLIGRQLQQEVSAELHRLSLQVIEYKLTDAIRVTPHGDFALSKNYLELRELQYADYIMAATLVEKDSGLIFNAQLIDFHTQIVHATAQVTLPRYLIDQVRSEQGVQLVGE